VVAAAVLAISACALIGGTIAHAAATPLPVAVLHPLQVLAVGLEPVTRGGDDESSPERVTIAMAPAAPAASPTATFQPLPVLPLRSEPVTTATSGPEKVNGPSSAPSSVAPATAAPGVVPPTKPAPVASPLQPLLPPVAVLPILRPATQGSSPPWTFVAIAGLVVVLLGSTVLLTRRRL
jgi:hypothetical protein